MVQSRRLASIFLVADRATCGTVGVDNMARSVGPVVRQSTAFCGGAGNGARRCVGNCRFRWYVFGFCAGDHAGAAYRVSVLSSRRYFVDRRGRNQTVCIAYRSWTIDAWALGELECVRPMVSVSWC